MALARSPAAGPKVVRHFYNAFFAWSCLLSAQSLHHQPCIVPTLSRLGTKSYSTASPPSPAGSSYRRLARRSVFLTHQDCLAITENDNALLKQLTHDVEIHLELADAVAGHRHRRLTLSGPTAAVEKVARRLQVLSAQPSSEDGLAQDVKSTDFARDKPAIMENFIWRSFSLSTGEIAHLDTLTSNHLDSIKSETAVEAIAFEPGPNGLLVLRIKGTKDASRTALLRIRALLASAVSTTSAAATIKDFKTAMRAVPSPVVVITTAWPHEGKRDWPVNRESDRIVRPGYRGMTVSSMTAVSLSPVPVVSFNVRKPSRTLDALNAKGSFNIHIPASNTLGKTIANAFTKPHEDPSETFHDLHAQTGITVAEGSSHRLPKIQGDGVQLRYRCKLLHNKSVEIGDHVVLFAEVEKVSPNPKYMVEDSRTMAEKDLYVRSGLLYVHGNYSRAGEIVTLEPETIASGEEGAAHVLESLQESASTASRGSEIKAVPPPGSVTKVSDIVGDKRGLADGQVNERDSRAPESPSPSHRPAASRASDVGSGIAPIRKILFGPRESSISTSSANRKESRLYSTSSSSGGDVDPSILSQTVGEYVFQPFDPKNKKRLARMRTRVKQKAVLEQSLQKLETLWRNGELKDEVFEATASHVVRMKEDAIANQLDEAELEKFLLWVKESMASPSGTPDTM